MKKVFGEFSKKKHIVEMSPEVLAYASKPGGVLVATKVGFFKVEKIEDIKDGYFERAIIEDEAT